MFKMMNVKKSEWWENKSREIHGSGDMSNECHEILKIYHNWAGNISVNTKRERLINWTDIHWDTVLGAGDIAVNKEMSS